MRRLRHRTYYKGLWAHAAVALPLAVISTAANAASKYEYADTALAVGCSTGNVPTTGYTSPVPPKPINSKTSAILSGLSSALDQITFAQMNATPIITSIPPASRSQAIAGSGLQPAARMTVNRRIKCAEAKITLQTEPQTGFDFLASKRLIINKTAFDEDWRRVSSDRVSSRQFQRITRSRRTDNFEKIETVNRWVNRSIAYAEDRDLFGVPDFWAGATRTLALRQGDCEDIALTKMELLAAAGIPRSDMILTIARDLVRNVDHALLIIYFDNRYFMLDNATDRVLEASPSYDYRPIVSYSGKKAWLHGY